MSAVRLSDSSGLSCCLGALGVLQRPCVLALSASSALAGGAGASAAASARLFFGGWRHGGACEKSLMAARASVRRYSFTATAAYLASASRIVGASARQRPTDSHAAGRCSHFSATRWRDAPGRHRRSPRQPSHRFRRPSCNRPLERNLRHHARGRRDRPWAPPPWPAASSRTPAQERQTSAKPSAAAHRSSTARRAGRPESHGLMVCTPNTIEPSAARVARIAQPCYNGGLAADEACARCIPA